MWRRPWKQREEGVGPELIDPEREIASRVQGAPAAAAKRGSKTPMDRAYALEAGPAESRGFYAATATVA